MVAMEDQENPRVGILHYAGGAAIHDVILLCNLLRDKLVQVRNPDLILSRVAGEDHVVLSGEYRVTECLNGWELRSTGMLAGSLSLKLQLLNGDESLRSQLSGPCDGVDPLKFSYNQSSSMLYFIGCYECRTRGQQLQRSLFYFRYHYKASNMRFHLGRGPSTCCSST